VMALATKVDMFKPRIDLWSLVEATVIVRANSLRAQQRKVYLVLLVCRFLNRALCSFPQIRSCTISRPHSHGLLAFQRGENQHSAPDPSEAYLRALNVQLFRAKRDSCCKLTCQHALSHAEGMSDERGYASSGVSQG